MVGIAYKTIYNWIDQGILDIQPSDLPDRGIRRHRAKETRGTFSHGRSIEERPQEVKTRKTFGHFEADTVLSGKRRGQAVATFVERQSRLTVVKRLESRSAPMSWSIFFKISPRVFCFQPFLTKKHLKTLLYQHLFSYYKNVVVSI